MTGLPQRCAAAVAMGWVLGLAACASGPAPQTSPRGDSQTRAPRSAEHTAGRAQTGIASWYGQGFQGKRTASGERYDASELTAAHKTLPFGTRVRVKSLVNGKEVVVRINDRGPFIAGRIIDLSGAAAKAIGLVGIQRVTIEVLQ